MRSIPPYQPQKRTLGGGVPCLLHGLYLCHRAMEDILSMSSHEPYSATASVPQLNSFNPAVMKKWGQSIYNFC